MKTKKNPTSKKSSLTLMCCDTPITDSTRSEIGQKISSALDLMNDPRFKEENFRQTEEQGVRQYGIYASNDEMSISFTIQWRGGQS